MGITLASLPIGSCRSLPLRSRGQKGRPCGGPRWRGWEPPPQSLRDSSPRGEQLDRTARALRAAVAASIVSSPPLPAASPPAERGERGNGDYAQVSRGGAAEGRGGGLAADQAGGVGSLPLGRCATAPPRGEQLDRTARALRAAVAASIVSSPPLPAASPPASRGEMGSDLIRGFLAAAGVGGVLHLGGEQVGDAVLDWVAEVERA